MGAKPLSILAFDDMLYAGRETGRSCGAEAFVAEYGAKNKIKIKNVNLILKTFDCVFRYEQLPALSDGDLRGLIQNNLNDYFPMPLIGYTVTYKRAPSVNGAHVLLAALPDVCAAPYMDIFKRLKIKINKIDIFQNAAAEYIFKNYPGGGAVSVLASERNGRMNATLMKNGSPVAMRDVGSRGDIEAFARMYGDASPPSSTAARAVYAADAEYESIAAQLDGCEIKKIDLHDFIAAYG